MADGLLDFLKSPEGQGLLSAAFGGLAYSRPGAPMNNLGRAGLAGLSGYGGAMERQSQLAHMAQAQEMQAMQMAELKRQQEKQRFLEGEAAKFSTPAAPGMGAQNASIDAMLPPEMRTGLPNTPAGMTVPAKPASFDMPGYMSSVMSKYPLDAIRMQQEAIKANQVKLGEGENIYDSRTGKPIFNTQPKLTDDLREYNYARMNGYKGSLQDWIVEQKKAGATNVNVSTEKSLLGKVAGEVGQQIGDSRAAAQGAIKTIQTTNRLREAIDSGKLMVGPTSNFRMFGAQVGSVLGVGGKDNEERLVNTRNAIQALASLELGAAAQMKGQGMITEAERAILKRAESGDIDRMTVPELKMLADVMDRSARFRIDMHNSQVEPLMSNPEAKAIVPFLKVPAPDQYKANTKSLMKQPAKAGGITFLGFE